MYPSWRGTAELPCQAGCPSGQRELTVNQPAMPTEVRILHPARLKDEGGRMKDEADWLHPSSLILHPFETRPRSSEAEHFFGKEEVMGPIPIVGSQRLVWVDGCMGVCA